MNNNAAWFDEALSHPDTKSITHNNGDKSLLYKGFKITQSKGTYEILDLRKLDFYTTLTAADTKALTEYGFIRGASYLMYVRDCRRVMLFERAITKLHEMLERFKKMLRDGKDIEFAKKRIRNCEENLEERKELIVYYTRRRNLQQKKFNFMKHES